MLRYVTFHWFQVQSAFIPVDVFTFEMTVVLDNGGFSVKVGYSTDEEPRFMII